MKVHGVSQSSGVERVLRVERGASGVVLVISDHASSHAGEVERERVLVRPEDLLGAVMSPAPGGAAVGGVRPPRGPAVELRVEVRGNEVLLATRSGTEAGADVAVGLDDLQDALEGSSPGSEPTRCGRVVLLQHTPGGIW